MANPFADELAAKLAAIESTDNTDSTTEDIAFQNDVQRACHAKVKDYGRQLFGEMFEADPTRPSFSLDFGSAHIFVSVWPWGKDGNSVMVDIGSWVIQGADITEDLMDFLLRRSFETRFGAFGLDKDDDILFYHRLAGESLDKEELRASVLAVARTADEYDEIIKSRWGGRRGGPLD